MAEVRKKKSGILEFLKYVFFVLYLGGLCAGVYFMRPIALARMEGERQALLQSHVLKVLPAGFFNQPWNESFSVGGVRIYPARKEEKVMIDSVTEEGLPETKEVTAIVLAGFAFKTQAQENLEIWTGFDLSGNPSAVNVESAGMGNADRRALSRKILDHLLDPESEAADGDERKIFESAEKAVEFFTANKPEIFMKANEAGQA